MELSLLAGQTVFVWLIALWLGLGALENIRHPKVNRDSVAEVMAMTRMAEVYPEIHAVFRPNAVASPRAHARAFSVIVWAECLVALLLLAGSLAMTGALVGLVPGEGARALAAWGAIGFSAIWGAFLVGGQWFHYWCGYEGSQATHFACTIWGIVTFLALQFPA